MNRKILAELLGRLYRAPENGDGGGNGGDGNKGAQPPGEGDKSGQPPAGTWYDSFKDAETKEWLKAYGTAYPDAESVARKARHLEQFVGADKAGRGIIVPKPDAKPEEWRAYYAKAGLPEKPDGYKLSEALAKDPVMTRFRDHAHKIGVPAPLFDGVASFIEAEMKSATDAQTAEFQKRSDKEMADLETEWGTNFDANTTIAQRAVKAFIPVPPNTPPAEALKMRKDTMNKLEGALGTRFVMNFFKSIGEALGEHKFVDADGVVDTGGMTVEAAKNEINLLKKDKEFGSKLMAKDAEATKKWGDLHRIAFGQQPQ